ncbi:MAG: nucleoside hydrolase, partial [Chloroflexota bacterium]|nr:nucleoside hydrolase [Chloroflexota bacterium]
PVASANLANDPEAAAVVYGSGAPIVQVGLDVCYPCIVTDAHLERIRTANTPATRLLLTVSDSIRQNYRRAYPDEGGARFNDLPCMAYVVDPSLFRGERTRVEIETTGTYTYGQTVADWRGQYGREPNATVLLEVDHARLVDLFAARVVRVGT